MEMAGTTDHSQYLFVVSKSSECGAGLYLWLQNWICSCLRDGNQSLHKLVHWSHRRSLKHHNGDITISSDTTQDSIENSSIIHWLIPYMENSNCLYIWQYLQSLESDSFSLLKWNWYLYNLILCILILLKSLCVLYLITCVILSY